MSRQPAAAGRLRDQLPEVHSQQQLVRSRRRELHPRSQHHDWLLSAQGEPHIFHIHVNPFQVIDVTTTNANGQRISIYNPDGTCKSEIVFADPQQLANQYCGMWHTFRDTIIVENNYQIEVRTRYDRYIGEYVLHCHILDHEDAGMMANIAIVPDLNAPGGGLGMAGMRHATQPTATPASLPTGHKH